MKKTIAIIGTALALTGGGLIGEYGITQANINDFKANLQVFEVSEDTADGIARYMKGGLFNGKEFINPTKGGERDEWVRACNEAVAIYGGNFGSIKSPKEFIKKCNWMMSHPEVLAERAKYGLDKTK